MNKNIGKYAKSGYQTGPRTEVGKFKNSLNRIKLSTKKWSPNVPKRLRDLYIWYRKLNTQQINSLLELQNLYSVMKNDMVNRMVERMEAGEPLTKNDLKFMQLIKETLVEFHKMKYGEKKIVETTVSIEDVRKVIFSKEVTTQKEIKKVVDAEVNNDTVS